MAINAAKRDAIERALIHHGIDYSPPGTGTPTWLISTHTGRLVATTTQVQWYCRGLADKEQQQHQAAERYARRMTTQPGDIEVTGRDS
jgi:hypothetical protein